MTKWSVTEPRRLTFDDPVRELHVRIVDGAVNVVGTDEGPARLEISSIEGPPLIVSQVGGALTVAYEDLPWKGFLQWLDGKSRRRAAVVSLTVPAGTRVEVGTIGATAVISGVDGRTEVRGVSGDTTLVGLTGPARTDTVTGNVEAQNVSGDLRFHSVSGDLTVVAAGSSVRADSVSGSMIVDVDPAGGSTDIGLNSVSGEIAIRLPHPADAQVEANTASGTVSNAFEDLKVGGQWGAKRITGRLGAGNGRLKATTVSGSIALLRRPPAEDERGDTAPSTGPRNTSTPSGPRNTSTADTSTAGGPRNTSTADTSAAGGPRNISGDNSTADRDDDATDDPTDGPTDKKVL
ncbi:DUF4097 family beta strand repeat-containing protein [Streptomyces ziwulingensis]|uniref:DUF4097 family beta strand repeat-containing protein n=1 Tax=Streptomyces ziwulingensis TaxID=1045501 RepID=A0ABP9CWN3_9ACTN